MKEHIRHIIASNLIGNVDKVVKFLNKVKKEAEDNGYTDVEILNTGVTLDYNLYGIKNKDK